MLQAGLIETPVLLAIGDKDNWVFTLPTLQMYLAMRREGKEVTLLRYPDQGHGIYGPSGLDLYQRAMKFIDSRLQINSEP